MSDEFAGVVRRTPEKSANEVDFLSSTGVEMGVSHGRTSSPFESEDRSGMMRRVPYACVEKILSAIESDSALSVTVRESILSLRCLLSGVWPEGKSPVAGSHPVVALLKLLWRVGWELSSLGNMGQKTSWKIAQVTGILLREKATGSSSFLTALHDLRKFHEKQLRRIRLAEDRAVASSCGRAKLRQARRAIAVLIDSALRGRSVPFGIHSFLNGVWSQYLVIVVLKYGNTSAEWSAAVGVVRWLVYGGERKQGLAPGNGHGNVTSIDAIASHIEAGLFELGYGASECSIVKKNLSAALMSRIASGPKSVGYDVDADSPTTCPDPTTAGRLECDLQFGDALFERVGSEDRVCQTDWRRSVGSWYLYRPDDISAQRLKLSWVDSVDEQCLFTGTNGMRVAEFRFDFVAQLLEDGRLRHLAPDDLFEGMWARAHGVMP